MLCPINKIIIGLPLGSSSIDFGQIYSIGLMFFPHGAGLISTHKVLG